MTAAAGTIPGTFAVTSTGEPTYTMPLVPVPGRAGVEPQLAVTYDGAGDGVLGAGFSLAGLSAITRCPSNLAQDGAIREVRYDPLDKLCLDGKRLVPTGGDATTVEYRAFPDAQVKVVGHFVPRGTTTTDALFFEVFTPSGLIVEYGNDDSGKPLTQNGTPQAWLATKAYDRRGNAMSYAYCIDADPNDGHALAYGIDEIRYTSFQGLTDLDASRAVTFVYAPKDPADVRTRYAGGMALESALRLDKIQMLGPGDALVRTYAFSYGLGPTTHRTLLAQVEECAGDGVCKPATRFTYTSSATGFEQRATSIPSPTSTLASPMLADLDGDGLDDLILPDTDKALTTPANPITQWNVAHNAGASASPSYFSSPALGLSEDWLAVAHPTAPADPTQIQPELGTALDFDQDGRQDLFLHDVWGTSPNWIVLLAQPDHTYKQHDTGIPRPFPLGAAPPPPTITSANASVHLADVNGDGVPDLIQCDDHNQGTTVDPSAGTWTAHLWKPAGGGAPAGWDKSGEVIHPIDRYPCNTELYTLDINGDGKVDLVVGGAQAGDPPWPTYNWVTRSSDATWHAWDTGLATVPAGGRVLFLDVNGDGLPDAVMSGHDHVLLTHFNTGSFTDDWGNPGSLFTGPVHDALEHDPLVEQDKYFNLATPLDFDGDGRQDLLMPVAEDTESDPAWMILKAQEAGAGGPAFTLVDAGIPFEPLLAGKTITLADPHGPRTGDVNGDGAPDVVLTMGSVFHVFENAAHDQDLLAAVSDGMNAHDPTDPGFVPNVSITYGHLTDPSITRSSPAQESDAYLARAGVAPLCAYPIACAVGSRRQVTAYTTNNGADTPRHFGIRYRDGRFHRLGRGFLGFAEKIVTDLDTLAGSASYYDNTTAREIGSVTVFPFAFQVAHEQRWVPGLPTQPDPTQIALAFTDIDRAFVPNYGGASYFTLPTVHHVRTFEGSFPSAGASTPEAYAAQVASKGGATLLRDTTRTVSKADAFGNVLVEDTTTAGVDLTLHVERTFKNDTDVWVLGQLQTRTECSTAAGLSQCRTLTRHTTQIGETADEGTATDDGIPDTQLTVKYERDAYGNVIQTTQDDAFAHHRVSKTIYDPEGVYPIASTNALGQTTQTSYDPRFGTLTAITDPNGLTTSRTYDGFGRLGLEVHPDGTQTIVTLSRTKGGQNKNVWRVTARSTTTGGADDTAEYDSLSRPVRWWWHGPEPTARARIMQEVAYDALGEHVARRSVPVSEDTPENKVLNDLYEYDALGHEVLHTMPWGATVQSAYEGMVVKVIDPLANVTTTTLDPLGRPTTVTDALQAPTSYTYGPFGALQTVTTPGGAVTRTTRDAFGRVRQLDDPDRGTTTSQHDGFGELVTSTDALGRTVTYQYDALGRTLSRLDQHGAENLTTTWTWDTAPHGIGKLGSLVSPDGAKTYSYTALGQPEALTLAVNGESDTLQATLGYDALGRVSTITYPTPAGAAPFVVARDYDAFGHVVTVRDGTGSTVHWRLTDTDDAGRYKSETFGNGVTSTRAYYPDKQSLASIATALGATKIQILSYDYDARRDLTSRTDTSQPQNPTERFRYDPVKRLTCAYFSPVENDTAPCALSYGYDPSGNLIGKSDVGTLAYKDPKHPHAVTSAGSDAFGYDAVGNQITRPGGATITYTPFDLPKTITQPTGAITLDYDGDQQRIRKTSPDKETLYFEGLYERTTTAAPAAVTHTYYIRSPERVVAVVTQSGPKLETLYVHVDHLGSTDKLTNAMGAVVESRSYDPFGQRRNTFWGMPPPASFPSLTTVGFTGQESDDELGLVNAKGRMYDPKVGRFLTTDPIVSAPLSAQSFNPYSYVRNNPLNLVDPSGFEGEDPSPPPDNCASCIWAPSYGWVKSVSGVDADGTPLIRAVVVKPVEQKVDGAQVGVTPKPVDVGTTGSASGTALEAVPTAPRDWTSHPAAQAAGGVLEGTYDFLAANAQGMRILIDPLGWMQQTQLAMLQNAITGYRQDGVIGGTVAAFNTVNPLYALAVTGVDAKEAWDKGDYWNAAKGFTILGLTVASVFVGGKGAGAAEAAGEGAAGFARRGAFGTGRPPHTAIVTVVRGGKQILQQLFESGQMTPAQRALGFPRSSLATHTEARAVESVPLEPGDTMTIQGEYEPCPTCRGAMKRAVEQAPGSSIVYIWPGGAWTAPK